MEIKRRKKVFSRNICRRNSVFYFLGEINWIEEYIDYPNYRLEAIDSINYGLIESIESID